MEYNLEMLYKDITRDLVFDKVDYKTIYKSYNNAYVIYLTSGDVNLDIEIIEILQKRFHVNYDILNGYILEIFCDDYNNIVVNITNEYKKSETLCVLPIYSYKQIANVLINELDIVQNKNKWITEKDYIFHINTKLDDNPMFYCTKVAKSSIVIRYCTFVKSKTEIEDKIQLGIQLFNKKHLLDNTKYCTYITLYRRSSRVLLDGIMCDNFGQYQRILIDLNNEKHYKIANAIARELDKSYEKSIKKIEELDKAIIEMETKA